jgi:hypothetical protein
MAWSLERSDNQLVVLRSHLDFFIQTAGRFEVSVDKLPELRQPAEAKAVGLKERSPIGLDFSSKSFVLSA